jgi:serine/threonine-protein kinase
MLLVPILARSQAARQAHRCYPARGSDRMQDSVIEAQITRLAQTAGWLEVRAYLAELLGRAHASDATVPRGPAPATMLSVTAEGEGGFLADDHTNPAVRDLWPPRYEPLVALGRGGMGEVWRVRDVVLKRTLALKLIRANLAASADAVARFREEAQVTARLQHPGIVPVHDLGWLPDGRWWYTMEEVRGRGLGDVIAEFHAGRSPSTFHRLVDAFHRACEAVAYAHAQGVIHRDLKPDNMLVGLHGEVRVVDWGLAKVMGGAETDWRGVVAMPETPSHTSAGAVLGTRTYMAPEQANGETARVGRWSDVYALGVILAEVLRGRGADEREPARPVPVELDDIRRRATAEAPEARYPDAGELAAEVGSWLDGARQREKALAVVEEARALLLAIPMYKAEAARLRDDARTALAAVPGHAPVADKLPGWRLEAEADERDREAERRELEAVQLLQAAFLHSPDLHEAHAALADWYRDRHAQAEAARDTRAATRAELRLRFHDRAGRHAEWLRGDGALTLVTDPPGAAATLYGYEVRDRRLVAMPIRMLGPTPLVDVALPMGSYLVRLRAPGCVDVRYPIVIGRRERWDGLPPGATAPIPVRLPRLGELGADDVYVPAGWGWSGGDPEANNPLPWRRLWFDALVARRFPVTNREYITFLDDLVATGRETEALRHAPRERAARVEEEGVLLYGRRDDGRFFLRTDADGDTWDPEWPAIHVDWYGARAYTRWLADRTGHAWRLPGDLEAERLARGADGRIFPWGNVLDPTWCHMLESHVGKPMLAVVNSCPTDESPWGVRGLGGNVREWCLDLFRPEGPTLDGAHVPPPLDPGDDGAIRVTRGGDWYGQARLSRATTRSRDWPQVRVSIVGFRVVRPA